MFLHLPSHVLLCGLAGISRCEDALWGTDMRRLLDPVAHLKDRLTCLMFRAWCFTHRPTTHSPGVVVWHNGKILPVRARCRSALSLPGGFAKRLLPPARLDSREKNVGRIMDWPPGRRHRTELATRPTRSQQAPQYTCIGETCL